MLDARVPVAPPFQPRVHLAVHGAPGAGEGGGHAGGPNVEQQDEDRGHEARQQDDGAEFPQEPGEGAASDQGADEAPGRAEVVALDRSAVPGRVEFEQRGDGRQQAQQPERHGPGAALAAEQREGRQGEQRGGHQVGRRAEGHERREGAPRAHRADQVERGRVRRGLEHGDVARAVGELAEEQKRPGGQQDDPAGLEPP